MNIYFHELKAYRKFDDYLEFVALLVALALLLSLCSLLYHVMSTSFKQMMEGFPEDLRKAIGLSIDSFGTMLGFYSYIFLYLTFGAIQAMKIGISIISKEIREKTADFLVTKPVHVQNYYI